MILYSKKILQFIDEIKYTIKEILSKEVRLQVGYERFYDKRQRASYPIRVVIYNNKSMLGYFDPSFYELGFHECLMYSKKEQLHALIRHELAHYLTFIDHGAAIEPHGPEFRAFCQKMGWNEEVYRATVCLEGAEEFSEIEENSILRKVQKLMALSSSSNKNEAEVAMIKSQQLLLKHNIDSKYLNNREDEKVFIRRILSQKKENAKLRSIARILETFFVSIVYRRGIDSICLEILGDAVNVEIAEYVALFLDSELEHSWKEAQKGFGLKGIVAKNSFFLGIARGYCDKVQALKKEYNRETTQALIILEKKLDHAKAMVYPRLSSSQARGSHCQASSSLGEKMGRSLNINTALNRSSSSSEALIGYQ